MHSVRMGIGFAVSSLGFLSGPPIAGALLGSSNHWARAIIFSGVSHRSSPSRLLGIFNYNIDRALSLQAFRLRLFRATGL